MGPMPSKAEDEDLKICVKPDVCTLDFKPKNEEYMPATGDYKNEIFNTTWAICH